MTTNEAEKNAETIKSNLAVVDEVSVALDKLAEEYRSLPVINIETADGYAKAKQRKKPLSALRTKCEKARKGAGRVLLAEKKRIDDTAKRIFDGIAEYEQPLIDSIKAADEAEAERIAELGRIEQARVDAITTRMDAITALRTADSIDDIDAALAHMDGETPSTADERQEDMQNLINMVRENLQERRMARVAQIDEAARLETQRAEQAEQQRVMDEKQAAMDAQQKTIDDAAAEAKRKADADQRERDIEAARQEAAEAARVQAIKDEQQRVADEAAEAERKAEVERQADAAKAAETARQAAMAPDRDKLVAWFESIPATPEMSSEEGGECAAQMSLLLYQMHKAIQSLTSADAERDAS